MVALRKSAGKGTKRFTMEAIEKNFSSSQILSEKSGIDPGMSAQYYLLQSRVLVETTANNLPHHRVFAHQNFGRSTQRDADLLHLLRPGR